MLMTTTMKKKKKKKKTEEEEEDRISALPDCLILQIVSLLPSTKAAIRTSKLSKRWKSLWTSIPILVFIQNLVIKNDYHRNSEVVSFINRTLAQCRDVKLDKFQLSIRYNNRFQSDVNNWIRYSVSRNVELLDLSLSYFDSGEKCVLEEQFFVNSCFRDLKFEGFAFNPKGAISWKMLRSLCISHAELDEDLIENILSGSPLLETLELCYCSGYRRLHITSKSVKNLVFSGYRNRPNDVIEIKAPNIRSLKILKDLELWKLLLVDVSSLVEAEIDYRKLGYWEKMETKADEVTLRGFLRKFRNLEELRIGDCCCKVLNRLKHKVFRFPSNMKLPDVTSPSTRNPPSGRRLH